MRAIRAAALLGGVCLLLLAASAAGGPPGQWTRLGGEVINFAEPGLARTANGWLHVVYVRKGGDTDDLVHLAVAPGGAVGAPDVAAAGWESLAHPDLVRLPNGSLRVFFGGIRTTSPDEKNVSMNTATAPAAGKPWALQPGSAVGSTHAYATSITGAGLAKDGTPVSAWAVTTELGFHYGTSPNDPDRFVPAGGCCLYEPEIAVDAAGGRAYLGFFSNQKGKEGLFVQAISPAGPQGGRLYAPGSATPNKASALQPGSRTSLTGRLGAPGVFLVYGQGYPTYKAVAAWRVGASKPQLALSAPGARHVNGTAGPNGRLWLMWERGGAIHVTRTNRAATAAGPVTTLKPPDGGQLFGLSGEGSAGPLDLFANVDGQSGQALWHQQVQPRLTLTVTKKALKNAKGDVIGRELTFRVGDAGDAVPSAKVKVGGKTLTTAGNGKATLVQKPAASISAAASKPGYVGAELSVK